MTSAPLHHVKGDTDEPSPSPPGAGGGTIPPDTLDLRGVPHGSLHSMDRGFRSGKYCRSFGDMTESKR